MGFFSLNRLRNIFAESIESQERKTINLGRLLAQQNQGRKSSNLQDFGFGVFSQWDEDGIFQVLADSVLPAAHRFIETGAEDYRESNTRFLMMKDNWKGLVVDGSVKNIQKIRNSCY